ncbi:hypothetical protein, partial [Peribacillus sp. NPDC096448]|uniref:hypothetical protein n=1 Tax=Peribacillus sp. NPDC096448 TaxID=3364395 RepID=UPI0037F842A4
QALAFRGRAGASSARACGVSHATLFPQESRTLHSNQLKRLLDYPSCFLLKSTGIFFVYSLKYLSIFTIQDDFYTFTFFYIILMGPTWH